MLSFRKPSAEVMRELLSGQAKLNFSYSAVGCTALVGPAGYACDHTRIKLGTGGIVFRRARSALERWDHFRLGWVEPWPLETPIQPGAVVAVTAHRLGLWFLNACRIIYVIDESGPIQRFGFAYGTLPVHVATGEERFLVEWDQASGDVWYDILAFSRPRHLLATIGAPYVRRVQKRFGRESAEAMRRVARDEAD